MSLFLERYQGLYRIAKPLLVALLLGGVSLYIYLTPTPVKNNHRQDIMVTGQNDIELATQVSTSRSEHITGLSNHSSLEKNQAMLFVFPRSGIYSFWMKDMNFPIDILWLNEDKKIVFIKGSAHPDDYPESYVPDTKAQYVLETVAGFSEREELKIGDQFTWEEFNTIEK